MQFYNVWATERRSTKLFDLGMLSQRARQDLRSLPSSDHVPIRDRRGKTIAFGGRVLSDEKPKYLNSPESAYHKGK